MSDTYRVPTKPRRFLPSVTYGNGWWACVTVEGASEPYWKSSRMTEWGAAFAAKRMARKYNRLEARGMVQ